MFRNRLRKPTISDLHIVDQREEKALQQASKIHSWQNDRDRKWVNKTFCRGWKKKYIAKTRWNGKDLESSLLDM
jgi:hypothetical protein